MPGSDQSDDDGKMNGGNDQYGKDVDAEDDVDVGILQPMERFFKLQPLLPAFKVDGNAPQQKEAGYQRQNRYAEDIAPVCRFIVFGREGKEKADKGNRNQR